MSAFDGDDTEKAIVPLPPVHGEISEQPSPESPYVGAGLLVLTERERQILTAPLRPEEIKEFPATAGSMAGLLYVDHVAIRRRLNEAVGPGAWALVPAAPPLKESTYVAQPWRLYIRGMFVAEGWGEQEFRLGTNTLSFPTALEGAKSTGLMRCAKDLGIGLELWDKTFCAAWKAKLKAPEATKAAPPSSAPAPAPIAPPAPTSPEKEPPVSDEPYEVTGKVTKVAERSGVTRKHGPGCPKGCEKGEHAWTMWTVTVMVSDNNPMDLTTFSTSIHEASKRLLASGMSGTFIVEEKPAKSGVGIYRNVIEMKGYFGGGSNA